MLFLTVPVDVILDFDETKRRVTSTFLQQNFSMYKLQMHGLIDSLEFTSHHAKAFYDSLFALEECIKALCFLLECRTSVLMTDLPSVDIIRIRVRARRVLTKLRMYAMSIINESGDHRFVQFTMNPGSWEQSRVLEQSDIWEWYKLIMKRVFDIAVYASNSLSMIQLTVVSGKDMQNITIVDSQIVPAVKGICQEVMNFTNFVHGL